MPDPLVDLTRSVRVEELAAAMVKIVLDGNEQQIVENAKLRELGGSCCGMWAREAWNSLNKGVGILHLNGL